MYCHDSIKAGNIECHCPICNKNKFMWETDYFDPVYEMPMQHWITEKHYRNHLDDGYPIQDSFYTPDVGFGVKIEFKAKDSDT